MMETAFYRNVAGKYCVEFCTSKGSYNFHFFLKRSFWGWGKEAAMVPFVEWTFTLGPLFMIAYTEEIHSFSRGNR